MGGNVYERAFLEEWYRDHLRPGIVDISSSGVPPMSFAQMCDLAEVDQRELDDLRIEDSHSLGSPALRTALAAAWGNGDRDEALVAQGSNEVVFLVLHTLLSAADEVVVLDPIYHAYSVALQRIGCTVRRWTLRPVDAFEPDLAALAALVTPRTKLIIVNFPHNPSGVSVTEQQQAEIVDLAEAHHAYLLWDNAFAELSHDRPPLPDVTRLYRRGLSVGTLSKAYGLPGLRIGWCLAPAPVVEATVGLRDQTTLFCSILVEHLAERVIRNRERFVGAYRDVVAGGRTIFLDWASSSPAVERTSMPAGGVTAMLRLGAVPDTEAFCRRLAADGVLLVPGAAFEQPAWARVGFAVDPDSLRAALAAVDSTAGV